MPSNFLVFIDLINLIFDPIFLANFFPKAFFINFFREKFLSKFFQILELVEREISQKKYYNLNLREDKEKKEKNAGHRNHAPSL
jgi:hypothetical protein